MPGRCFAASGPHRLFCGTLPSRSRAGRQAQIRCQVDTLESGLNLSLEHALNYLDLVLALPRMVGRSVVLQFLRVGMSLRGVEIPFHPQPHGGALLTVGYAVQRLGRQDTVGPGDGSW